jgi:hypothetical protein
VDGDEDTRFLPPEPSGPEPDLGDAPPREPPPAPAPPPPQQQQQQQTYGYPPPPPGQEGAYGPPPGQGYPPPPGYGGYQAPPPGWGQPPQWAWQPPVPDNGQAVAGFVFSLVAVGLLVISAGLSSIISVGCAVTGIACSRNGKRKVARGETPKHRGLAQAGYIVGWVGLGLSILATAGWILLIVLGAVDEGSSGGSGTPAYLRSAVALAVGA